MPVFYLFAIEYIHVRTLLWEHFINILYSKVYVVVAQTFYWGYFNIIGRNKRMYKIDTYLVK